MNPAARERRFRRIKEIGCLPCRMRGRFRMPEIHHQNCGAHAGGARLGDEYTVGLCSWHHRGVPSEGMLGSETRVALGPSLAREPNEFRREFGSDSEMLNEQNRLIAERERIANPAARSPSLNLGAVSMKTGDAAADQEGAA